MTTICWIAITLATDVNGPQRMHPKDCADPLTFDLALPADNKFLLDILKSTGCVIYGYWWSPEDVPQWLWWSLNFSSSTTMSWHLWFWVLMTIGWIVIKCRLGIYDVPLRMKCYNFSDPLTFLSSTTIKSKLQFAP